MLAPTLNPCVIKCLVNLMGQGHLSLLLLCRLKSPRITCRTRLAEEFVPKKVILAIIEEETPLLMKMSKKAWVMVEEMGISPRVCCNVTLAVLLFTSNPLPHYLRHTFKVCTFSLRWGDYLLFFSVCVCGWVGVCGVVQMQSCSTFAICLHDSLGIFKECSSPGSCLHKPLEFGRTLVLFQPEQQGGYWLLKERRWCAGVPG